MTIGRKGKVVEIKLSGDAHKANDDYEKHRIIR